MESAALVNIGEASRILGVSEAALRQWTYEGKIKAFVTPGGHRRYSRTHLKKFMGSHPRMLGIKDLVSEIEGTAELHREIAHKSLERAPWYNNLSQESQTHLASLGRRILTLIIKYIIEPSKRPETIQLACDVGRDFGETLAKLGLPLTEAVEAFLMHRDPVINAATQLMKKREAFTGRIVEAIPLVAHVMDKALVALVVAHQQYRDEIQSETKGESAGDINFPSAV